LIAGHPDTKITIFHQRASRFQGKTKELQIVTAVTSNVYGFQMPQLTNLFAASLTTVMEG
jgi:hypothetical protein